MTAPNSPYDRKRVLITGGDGFIGRHLARRLSDEGAGVTVLTRREPPDAEVPAGHMHADVRDDAAVSAAIARGFDYVFHLAAYSGQIPGYADHEQSLMTNCLGLLNVLDAIRRLSSRTLLCFPSSRLVYGRPDRLPVAESHRTAPLSLYGIHKRTGEEYCAYYGERWGVRSVVLRLANPYGPHRAAHHHRYNVANWMIHEIARGGTVTIFGDGAQLRDYVYIDDAVEAMLAAAAAPYAHGRVYNAGSGAGVALRDFARAAIEVAGVGSLRFEPWPPDYLQVETGDYVADIARIRDELGWVPRVPLRDGLARTIEAQRRTFARAVRPEATASSPLPATFAAVAGELREAA